MARQDRHEVIQWIERECLLGAGNGPDLYQKPYILHPWQKTLINNMYSKDGTKLKRPKNLILFGAKKCGKTATISLLVFWRLCNCQGENYFLISNSYNQAGIIFRMLCELISLNTPISKDCKITTGKIVHKKNKNTITQLYQSQSTTHGLAPSVIVADEIGEFDSHAWGQLKVLTASQTLLRHTQQFLMGNVPSHPGHESLDLIKRKQKDPEWQIKLFKSSGQYSWRDIRSAKESNPMLSDPRFPQVKKWYKHQLALAKQNKQDELAYRRFGLGEGCVLDASDWISQRDIKTCDKSIFDKAGLSWAIGIDPSLQGGDSTSWVAIGMAQDPNVADEDQKFYVFGKIYYSRRGINQKPQYLAEKLELWASQGYLTIQNSEVILQKPIIDDIKGFLAKKRFKRDITIVIDPLPASGWLDHFSGEFRAIPRAYRPKECTGAIRILQRASQNGNIYLIGDKTPNPAVVWQAQCGCVNERSKFWATLGRKAKNKHLNIDYWVSAILGTSELILPKQTAEVFVV